METIIALFLITVGVLEVAGVFQSAFNSRQRAANTALATAIATKRVAQVRQQATAPAVFSNWSGIDGTTSDTEFPDFAVTTSSEWFVQYSPCSLSEQRYTPNERTMSRSLRKVTVSVSWDSSKPSSRVEMSALVGAPKLGFASLGIVESLPSSLIWGSTTTLTAVARDSGGNAMPDLFYNWEVIPSSGNANVSSNRSGRTATLLHNLSGGPPPGPGQCELILSTVYQRALQQKKFTVKLDVKPPPP